MVALRHLGDDLLELLDHVVLILIGEIGEDRKHQRLCIRLLRVAQTAHAEVKARLKTETDAAIARGVFGIPTMVVADELFWGLDQFGYLELFLQGRDPLAGVDWEELRSDGPAARRTGAESKD